MRKLRILHPAVRIQGTVEHGFCRGSTALGYPTANINSDTSPSLSQFLCSPDCPDGVYMGWASLPSIRDPMKAAISVGLNPTFEDSEVRLLEAYLLDYKGPDFYGETLRLVITGHIRASLKFDSLESLKNAIAEDCEFASVNLGDAQKLKNSLEGKFLTFED
jgi:riboflavin kinase/FMN adenylyltransferase